MEQLKITQEQFENAISKADIALIDKHINLFKADPDKFDINCEDMEMSVKAIDRHLNYLDNLPVEIE